MLLQVLLGYGLESSRLSVFFKFLNSICQVASRMNLKKNLKNKQTKIHLRKLKLIKLKNKNIKKVLPIAIAHSVLIKTIANIKSLFLSTD